MAKQYDLRYPIGKFSNPEQVQDKDIQSWIEDIASFPRQINKALTGLDEGQLQLTYRPEGWTIQQVVHHCADSHMNAFSRFKLALTEDEPTIRPYKQDLWAELDDTIKAPVEWAANLLEGLHGRWTLLLKSMSPTDFQRAFIHPEYNRRFQLDEALALYSWHCRHHLAHIKFAKAYEGSFPKES